MLEEQKKKLKEIFTSKSGESNKRKVENLVVFIILLIITVIIINTVWFTDKKENKNLQNTTDKVLAKEDMQEAQVEQATSSDLEEKLKNILQKIEGVGKVEVLLTYSQSSQTMAMYNEDSTKSDTEETDTSGGNRKISETTNKKEVIYQEIDGEKIPVTQSIIKPKIEGAIITASRSK